MGSNGKWSIADRYFYQAGPLPEDPKSEPDAVKEGWKCPCKTHRTYKALRQPRGNCQTCWRFFVKMNP